MATICCVDSLKSANRICGVMGSVLALSEVEHGFKPQLGQTKDHEMCLSGATCLPADCCFSELAR